LQKLQVLNFDDQVTLIKYFEHGKIKNRLRKANVVTVPIKYAVVSFAMPKKPA